MLLLQATIWSGLLVWVLLRKPVVVENYLTVHQDKATVEPPADIPFGVPLDVPDPDYWWNDGRKPDHEED